ncbi:RNA polymerase sigma factor [Neolewinella persica]|uniref:RNA polymerase sigma factor n=1 Tax=Neolewinella persica TaxID=70998 RepID=UPI00146A5E9A|nr:sigma-70 family RNA polymerase sigma factor [Neolewinella persica]
MTFEQKNFNLSEIEFNELRDKLVNGDQHLFEHIFLQHFQKCMDYVIREDKAEDDVAYDATMDAFLSFRMKLVQGKVNYGNLRFLLTRMARQHYYKRAKKENTLDLDLIQHQVADEDFTNNADVMELLQRGWSTLGEKCKHLLHSFYYLGQPLKSIAARTNRKPDALRKQKQRCVDQLRGVVLVK